MNFISPHVFKRAFASLPLSLLGFRVGSSLFGIPFVKPFSLWTFFYFSMIMLGVGCGPQVGPFLSRPTMGSIRGEGTPPQTLAVIWRKKGVLSLSSGCSRKIKEGDQPPPPPPPPPPHNLVPPPCSPLRPPPPLALVAYLHRAVYHPPPPLPPPQAAVAAAAGKLCHHPHPLHGPISLPPSPSSCSHHHLALTTPPPSTPAVATSSKSTFPQPLPPANFSKEIPWSLFRPPYDQSPFPSLTSTATRRRQSLPWIFQPERIPRNPVSACPCTTHLPTISPRLSLPKFPRDRTMSANFQSGNRFQTTSIFPCWTTLPRRKFPSIAYRNSPP